MILSVYAMTIVAGIAASVFDIRYLREKERRRDTMVYAVVMAVAMSSLLAIYFVPRDFSLITVFRSLKRF